MIVDSHVRLDVDRLALGTVLGITAATTVDGETRPTTPNDLIGEDGYRAQLDLVLDNTIYPGWPEIVQRYRTQQISLDQMWKNIAESTDQVLTLLGHCQAEVYFAGLSDVFENERGEHRGAQLYIEPMWTPIIHVVTEQGVVPEFADFASAELELLDAGELAVLGMWGRLGLTVEVRDDRQYAIWVSAPEW